ncbi:MAG: hypothetical protein WAP52_02095 [Candidatus Sungiibacteriota bacterium]
MEIEKPLAGCASGDGMPNYEGFDEDGLSARLRSKANSRMETQNRKFCLVVGANRLNAHTMGFGNNLAETPKIIVRL